VRLTAKIFWKEHYSNYPWMVKVTPSEQNSLIKVSAVDCFQIRSVSIERFTDLIGCVEPNIITQVQDAVNQIIGTV